MRTFGNGYVLGVLGRRMSGGEGYLLWYPMRSHVREHTISYMSI